jgi:ubiquinone biosynthesis protein
VKLGQFIATAGGLLPEEWVEAFAWCRDEVPHLPPRVPRRVIRRAFGCRVRDIFAEFDPEPIGAASIAQVHRGVLHDGREVVVKIRRPGLRQRFASDIRAMAAAAWAAEKVHHVARAGNPSGFVELFAQLVLEELDFRIEALNMVELGVAAEHAGADYVRFPRPVPGLVTSRVLVMEHLPGAAYTSVEVDKEIGENLLRFAIQGVLEHTLIYGVFHGDLHAGNVLLDSDTGRLSLVDFGIVGRLGPEQRMALGQFLVAFAHMNVRAQLEAMVDFGAIPAEMDLDVLVADIEREVRPDELPEDADVAELADRIGKLVQVVARHGVRLPKELVLFFKNLLYLNGFAASVAPEANLLGEIAPVFGYFQQKYGDAIDLMAFLEAEQRPQA